MASNYCLVRAHLTRAAPEWDSLLYAYSIDYMYSETSSEKKGVVWARFYGRGSTWPFLHQLGLQLGGELLAIVQTLVELEVA